jgi:hypothetical protein
MDVPEITSSHTIVAPYPTSTRQLRNYVVHAPNIMSREIRSIQRNHVAYITQGIPETRDQVYKIKFAMSQASFNSVAGFDDGSDTPNTYKEVLKPKNQSGWWASINKEIHAMETKGFWEVVLISSMPAGQMVAGI